jgi:dolichol-phosphate mannosyltransferase
MYRGLSVVAVIPVLNEERKIIDVVRRVPRDVVDEILVVDDGSTDNSAAVARDNGATVISLGKVEGVGAALRTGYAYARDKDYDAVITIAGNNKDFPEEAPLLLDPIVDEAADFVQGSRWLRPESLGPMPLYRKLATRVHPLLFSLVARRRVTESTNGFRAFTKRVLLDDRIVLDQRWLDNYELEPYLYIKVIRLGYTTREVPVRKVYPPKQLGQTKMAPITGWWSILRPLVLLGLGIKK